MVSYLKGRETNYIIHHIHKHNHQTVKHIIIIMATRVGEHKHADSAVCDHLNGCHVCKDRFSVDLFKILDFERK